MNAEIETTPALSPRPSTVEPILPLSDRGLERILVPTDFSAPSLKALDYAQALGGDVVRLLFVCEPIDLAFASQPVNDGLEEQIEKALERSVEEHAGRGPKIEHELRNGDPATEIAQLASAWPAELIVLSTHGRSGFSHLLMGSVAQNVVRRAPCPVLVVRKHGRDFVTAGTGGGPKLQLRRILVPIDFSPRSQAALHFAVQFAQRFGGKLTLLHCVYISDIFGTTGLVQFYPEDSIKAEMKFAVAELEKLFTEEAPEQLRDELLVREGAPLEEIEKLDREKPFDLIICGTHGRSVVRHAFLGSKAEGLVQHARCPVIVVPSR